MASAILLREDQSGRLCSGFNFGDGECQFYKVPTGNKWDSKKFCASGKFQSSASLQIICFEIRRVKLR